MNKVLEGRKRPGQRGGAINADDEDAGKLYFGSNFDMTAEDPGLYALNMSEARLLIIAALQQRNQDASAPSVHDGVMSAEEEEELFAGSNEVLRKTHEYLDEFARFKDAQTVNAVEHLLKSSENADLHPFEVAQLGSLVCDDSEEAKTLIPSLAYKKTDEELQVLLDHLRRFG